MFLLFLLAYYSNIFHNVSALPAPIATPTPPQPSNSPPNATTQPTSATVGWTSTPQLRGTSDLLISCLTTLSLCAWTAYHPNVQCAPRAEWRRWAHRFMWMLTAIFFPELVLLVAWEQWWCARGLRRIVNGLGERAVDGVGVEEVGDGEGEEGACEVCKKVYEGGDVNWDEEGYNLDLLFGEEESVSRPSTRSDDQSVSSVTSASASLRADSHSGHSISISEKPAKTSDNIAPTWTMSQAFFALSGGFAIPSSTFSLYPRLTLTAPGLLYLARLGLLPPSTAEEVSDKSKADLFAKVLVCLQAGWFLVQCIARVAQKLPITLLEVHVLAHVLCAFAMYGLWIDKPYDVGSPILCEDERVVNLAALWSLHVEPTDKAYADLSYTPTCTQTTKITLTQIQSAHTNTHQASAYHRYLSLIKRWFYHLAIPGPSICRHYALPPETAEQHHHLQRVNAALTYLKTRNRHFTFTTVSRLRWRTVPAPTQPSDTQTAGPGPTNSRIELPHAYTVPLTSALSITGLSAIFAESEQESSISRTVKAYVLMSAAYGGLHLAAWNAAFASTVEMWMWRASGLVMVALPVVGVLAMTGLAGRLLGRVVGVERELGRRETWVVEEENEEEGTEQENVSDEVGSVTRGNLQISRRRRFGLVCKRRATKWAMYLVQLVTGPAKLFLCYIVMMYPIARLYVLVESLIGLRSVERSVYQTVEWTNFIPHGG